MTTAIEHNDGRQLSVGDGKVQYRKVFILTGYTAELDIIADFGKAPSDGNGGTTPLPYVGQTHPEMRALYAWSYNLAKMPGTTDMWRIEWEYRTVSPASPRAAPNTGGLTRGPNEVGFEEITGSLTGSFALMYRADPANDDPAGTDFDIGGQSLDVAGSPTSVMRAQYQITVARTSTSQFDDNVTRFGSAVGTRADSDILGIEGGRMLYKGAQIQRVETQVYRVVHTWLYDKFAHLIQVPKYEADGTCKKKPDGTVEHVYHKQPFPLGTSHKFLSRN